MQHKEMLLFFQYQRQIFGICPCCGEFYRLSDCKIYKDEKAPTDWLDKIAKEERRLDTKESIIEEKLEELRASSREIGRKKATRLVKKVDTVFAPQKLNPDDAKVIFHPVDFVVFNGMKDAANGDALKNIVLLDGQKRSTEGKKIQKNLAKVIEKENYEWLTLRVDNEGGITQE